MSKEIFTRREFLKLVGAAAAVGALSEACRRAEVVFETPTPEKPTPEPTKEPTVKPSPLPTDVPPTPIPSPEFLPPVGGEKPEPTDTPKPTKTPTPELTPIPEPLSTFKEVLFLNPGGMSDIGGVSPREVQDQEDKIKVLEAGGMIPEAPEENLSLIWFRSGEGSWTAWATKIYSADEEAEEKAGNPGVWVLKENQWQKKETPLKFVSGYKFYASVEGSGLPPHYLGREEGKVDWVLQKDPLEDPAAQASSLETGEKTGVALFWGGGNTLFAVFGAVPPYLPEGKVRVKADFFIAAPTFLVKEDDLAIVMEDEGRNPVGFWNLEKGGWTKDPENGVEYEDLFEEPEPTPTPEPKGYREEHKTEFLGVPVEFALVVDESLQKRGEKIHFWGVTLNPDFPGGEQEERVAEAILRAHWQGWVLDKATFAREPEKLGWFIADFGPRANVSFEEYVERLKNSEDLSYPVTAFDVENVTYKAITVDPTKKVELVWTAESLPLRMTLYAFCGFRSLDEGGVRISMMRLPEADPDRVQESIIEASFRKYSESLSQLKPGITDEEIWQVVLHHNAYVLGRFATAAFVELVVNDEIQKGQGVLRQEFGLPLAEKIGPSLVHLPLDPLNRTGVLFPVIKETNL